MWTDILLGIATSIGKAIFTSFLNKQESNKLEKSLVEICNNEFESFSDTSLDTDEFYKFVKSSRFSVIIRNYYFSIADGISNQSYFDYICSVTAIECPSTLTLDIKHFFEKFNELFCSRLHRIIKNNAELSALLALLTISHREIIQKISESEDTLIKYLNSISQKNLIINDELIKQYHLRCEEDFSTISFSGIAGAEIKKPRTLDDLYVKNYFHFNSKDFLGFEEEQDETNYIQFSNIFNFGNKIVMLGGAGFGKTTSVNYLFCNYKKIFGIDALKIKINLKDYASQIYSNELEILDCFCREFNKRLPYIQLKDYDIKSVLSNHLVNGNCLVIFDALDEIPQQSVRDKVRDEVANFCNVYYLNRYIITSREVGYLRNRFNDSFLHIKISLFTDTQIKEYVEKWFKVNCLKLDFDEFYKNFDVEVNKSNCRDLIRNPIILILALIIFNAERNLPNRRIEFYRKCIDTFLVSREDRKEAFHMTTKIRNILGDDLIVPKIAYYRFVHQNENSEYRFTMDELQKSIMNALEVIDTRNWIDTVKNYSEYLVNRTELIKEIDEDCYDFTHKTFNEYFLSLYFAKGIENQQLLEMLDKWIGDANYDELAKLIIEVVIEKNDYMQHKTLMCYMFNKLGCFVINSENTNNNSEYNVSLQKAADYSSILCSLFQNGMIQPRFQEEFHNCLLNHPQLIGGYLNRRLKRFKDTTTTSQYDIDRCWDMYNDMLKNNLISPSHSITILYNFSETFYKKAIKSNNAFNKRIVRDFYFIVPISDVYDQSNKRKNTKAGQPMDNIHFYLVDKFENVKNSPEVYLLILKLITMLNDKEINDLDIINLLKFSFSPVSIFTSFLDPNQFYRLMSLSFVSSNWLLVTLISLIKCGKFNLPFLLHFACDSRERIDRVTHENDKAEKISEKQISLAQRNAKKLLRIFTKCENINDVICEFKSKNLYDSRYSTLYNELYDYFTLNEKEVLMQNYTK